MADKDYNKIQMYRKEYLTRKLLLAGTVMEFFDGDGNDDQEFRLSKHADQLLGVLQLSNAAGSAEFPPNMGKMLIQKASLTGASRAYTFSEGNLITMGDATDGYKPPDTSGDSFFAIAVVYIPVTGLQDPAATVLTWTNENVADDVVPGTDTEIWVKGTDRVSLIFNTTGPVGGSTFDIKILTSVDNGTTYTTSASASIQPFTAQGITKVEPATIDVAGYDKIKARMDIIGVNMGSGKSVTLSVQPVWRY